MKSSRNGFLRFFVAGSVAAGCPTEVTVLTEPQAKKAAVSGHYFEFSRSFLLCALQEKETQTSALQRVCARL